MGSSGAFKGSGGKDAGSLRDAIAEWLGDESAAAPPGDVPQDGQENSKQGEAAPAHLDPDAIAPAIRLWSHGTSRGSGGGVPGASGSGGTSSESAKGKSRGTGGVQRTVSSVAGPAGRASSLAQAFSAGDRQAIESAGLNFDELRRLDDPLEVGRQITAVAFDTQPDGTIEDSETRLIIAELVSWIMETPEKQKPEPVDIARRSIELMIVRATLTEVGNTIRKEKDPNRRREAENEIRRAARVKAAKVNLNSVRTSSTDIAKAIEDGVKQLALIYGDKE